MHPTRRCRLAALTQPALTSPPWSKNGLPVRGSTRPTSGVGCRTCSSAGSTDPGMILLIAMAIASPDLDAGMMGPTGNRFALRRDSGSTLRAPAGRCS